MVKRERIPHLNENKYIRDRNLYQKLNKIGDMLAGELHNINISIQNYHSI